MVISEEHRINTITCCLDKLSADPHVVHFLFHSASFLCHFLFLFCVLLLFCYRLGFFWGGGGGGGLVWLPTNNRKMQTQMSKLYFCAYYSMAQRGAQNASLLHVAWHVSDYTILLCWLVWRVEKHTIVNNNKNKNNNKDNNNNDSNNLVQRRSFLQSPHCATDSL